MNLTEDIKCAGCGDMIGHEPGKFAEGTIAVEGSVREWYDDGDKAAKVAATDADVTLFCGAACMIAALQAKKGS